MNPKDLRELTEVELSYDWKGRRRSYQVGNTYIPIAAGNSHFEILRNLIEEGKCNTADPKITFARPTFGKHGELTGYDTNVGFIPSNLGHPLLKQIQNNFPVPENESDESKTPQAGMRIEKLIFTIAFDRTWPNLDEPLSKTWRYRSNNRSPWRSVDVECLNLPGDASGLLPDIAKHFGCECEVDGPLKSFLPLRKGILNVEILVSDLRSFFKGERKAGFPIHANIVDDLVEQNLVRTGRTDREGPGITWLLQHASLFLGRAVADIANGVAAAFRIEFGGQRVGYIGELELNKNTVIFAKLNDGTVRMHHISLGGSVPYTVPDQWIGRPVTPDTTPEKSLRELDHYAALSRIRDLKESGFMFEAIALTNGFLEIYARSLALAFVIGDPDAENEIENLGHQRRLDIIFEGLKVLETGYVRDTLEKFYDAAKSIYPHRNGYLHALKSINHDYWRTVDIERETGALLEPVLDHFHGRILLSTLASIANGQTGLSEEAMIAARAKATQKLLRKPF